MTLAYDIVTGRLLGQILDETPRETLERDAEAVRLYLILARDGYSSVRADSVRIETTR